MFVIWLLVDVRFYRMPQLTVARQHVLRPSSSFRSVFCDSKLFKSMKHTWLVCVNCILYLLCGVAQPTVAVSIYSYVNMLLIMLSRFVYHCFTCCLLARSKSLCYSFPCDFLLDKLLHDYIYAQPIIIFPPFVFQYLITPDEIISALIKKFSSSLTIG